MPRENEFWSPWRPQILFMNTTNISEYRDSGECLLGMIKGLTLHISGLSTEARSIFDPVLCLELWNYFFRIHFSWKLIPNFTLRQIYIVTLFLYWLGYKLVGWFCFVLTLLSFLCQPWPIWRLEGGNTRAHILGHTDLSTLVSPLAKISDRLYSSRAGISW